MKILVVGSGAREHAIVHALTRDESVSALHAAPGNPGIADIAQVHHVDPLSPTALADLAWDLEVDLAVIGPEAPLVAGVGDEIRRRGIAVFGPDAAAARIEGSKAFAKDIMVAAGVPTARARLCTNEQDVRAALASFGAPYVVKDDGLAAGKGVVVTDDLDVAIAHAKACLKGGVVVEEYLDGPEVSLFCLSDGRDVVPLAPAQDYKRLLEGDAGPNTGGMGAYSPLPWAPEGLVEEVVQNVALPTVRELARRGTPFVGLLYCGLALTSRGVRVIEFNARFGDPETQVVLARLKTPLAGVLHAAATGRLGTLPPLQWADLAAVTVVLAAHGYPNTPRSGDVIEGLPDAAGVAGAYVLHAGTAVATAPVAAPCESAATRSLRTAGGRILSVVGTGADLSSARTAAYEAAAKIRCPGIQYRTDIAAGL